MLETGYKGGIGQFGCNSVSDTTLRQDPARDSVGTHELRQDLALKFPH